MNKKLKTSVYLSLLLSGGLCADTLYVSPSGSNLNSGTSPNQAFKSIQHSIDQMAAGDTLILMDGFYNEQLDLKSDITIKAQNPRKAIISGAQKITGFQNHTNDIYKTNVGGTVYNVFYDDSPMTWAQWPNINWQDNWKLDQKWANVNNAGPGTETDGVGFLTADLDDLAGLDYSDGHVFIRYGKGNSCYSRKIVSHTNSRIEWDDTNFYIQQRTGEDGWRGAVGHGLATSHVWHPNKSKFFIVGDLDLLDTSGEWFEENGTLYFHPPAGDNINERDVYIQTSTVIARETDPISNLTISGVDFFAGSLLLENTNNSNIVIEDMHFSYIGGELLYTDRIEGQALEKPIVVNGSNITIDKSLFAGAKNKALRLQGSNITIQDSVFMENNRNSNFESRPLYIAPNGYYKITGNTLFNNASDAIYILTNQNGNFSTKPEISYNNLFNAGRYNSDVSGIYLPIRNAFGVEIHHNWLHNVNGNALRLDLAGVNLTAHHNVFWSSHRGMNIEGYFGFNIYNNTGYDNDINSFTKNQLEHFGDNFAVGDLSYPPIDDWNIVNNLLFKIEDRAYGPRERDTFNQSNNQGILDPIRQAETHIIVGVGSGKVVGNINNKTGYTTSLFTSVASGSLNLVPNSNTVNNGASQTAAMLADGVDSLDTFRGAYAVNDPSPWVAGSSWLPEGVPILNTIAASENFAKDYIDKSLVPRVADSIPRERVPVINGSFELDTAGTVIGDELVGWEAAFSGNASAAFQINQNNSSDGNHSFRSILLAIDNPSDILLETSSANLYSFNEGDHVIISFYAKSNTENTEMRLKFRDSQNNNSAIENYVLDSEFKKYTLETTITESRSDYLTSFFLGVTSGTIWIDDVEITVARFVDSSPNTTEGYSTWLANFGVLEGEDLDDDAIPNLLEYVLSGHPQESDLEILPSLIQEGDSYLFHFTRNTESLLDTTQTFQYSTDLTTWSSIDLNSDTASEVEIINQSPILQSVNVRLPVEVENEEEIFVRLHVISRN